MGYRPGNWTFLRARLVGSLFLTGPVLTASMWPAPLVDVLVSVAESTIF